MTPYDTGRALAWDMARGALVCTEYMTVYDGVCQVVRIPDVTPAVTGPGTARALAAAEPAASDSESRYYRDAGRGGPVLLVVCQCVTVDRYIYQVPGIYPLL